MALPCRLSTFTGGIAYTLEGGGVKIRKIGKRVGDWSVDFIGIKSGFV